MSIIKPCNINGNTHIGSSSKDMSMLKQSSKLGNYTRIANYFGIASLGLFNSNV
jgi:hypothetical protein